MCEGPPTRAAYHVRRIDDFCPCIGPKRLPCLFLSSYQPFHLLNICEDVQERLGWERTGGRLHIVEFIGGSDDLAKRIDFKLEHLLTAPSAVCGLLHAVEADASGGRPERPVTEAYSQLT